MRIKQRFKERNVVRTVKDKLQLAIERSKKQESDIYYQGQAAGETSSKVLSARISRGSRSRGI